MTIQSVFDPSFSKYGQVLTGYDLTGLLDTLEQVTPVPEGTEYVPEQPELMALPVCGELSDRAYGGMPIQIGWCNGHNTKLNCLEYHRDSELNVGVQDFILLLAKREEMADGRLDTGKVQAFLCPAGTLVEVYATTLHYAPCSAKRGAGLPLGGQGAHQLHLAAPRRHSGQLHRIDVGGGHDLGPAAQQVRGVGHPLGVVARGGAHQTMGALLLRQGQGLVHGAPDLEGSDGLKALVLQIDLTAQRLVQSGYPQQRSADDIGGDARPGLLYVLQCDHRGSSFLISLYPH